MADAQAAGARLLLLPEFACAQWLSFAPVGLPVNQQVPWPPCASCRPAMASPSSPAPWAALGISILWTIGIIVLIIGIVFLVLGQMDHAIGGRKYWY